jgi:4-amino-4-deoxy-L-arabinose transferase-like glycosyltransferase
MKHLLQKLVAAEGAGNRLAILIVVAGFLAVELVLFRIHASPLVPVENDGLLSYLPRASGVIFQADAYHGIGYSLLIRAVRGLGLNSFSAAKTVSILFGGLFVVTNWVLWSALGRPREALLAAVIVAFSSTTLMWSSMILSDMMAVSLAFASLAVLLVPSEPRNRYHLVAGCLCGLAYLTRYVYVILLGVPLLLFLLPSRPRATPLEGSKPLAWFFAGFLVVTLPWFVHLTVTQGSPFWNHLHLNVAYQMYEGGGSATPPKGPFPSVEEFESLWDLARSDPALFARSWLASASSLPAAILRLTPPVGPIAIIGLFFWLRSSGRRELALIAVASAYAAVACLVWIQARFMLFFVPFVAIAVASTVQALPSRITWTGGPALLARIVPRIPLRLVATSVLVLLLALDSAEGLRNTFFR